MKRDKKIKTSSPYKIKTDWKIHVIFAVLFSIPLIIGIMVIFKRPDFETLKAFSVCLFVFLFPQLWLYAFKIMVYEDKLTYKTLFTGTKEILYSAIKKAEFKMDFGSKIGPPLCMNLYDNKKYTKNHPFKINIKVFDDYDLAILIKKIMEKAPNAKIHKTLIAISKCEIKSILIGKPKLLLQLAITIFIIFFTLGLIRALMKIFL